MIYCFDLDGTLCWTDGMLYLNASPRKDAIERVNRLFDEGHTIIIDTARGSATGIDWHEDTRLQLERWGVKFHQLRTGAKIVADRYIDDRGTNVEDWLNE